MFISTLMRYSWQTSLLFGAVVTGNRTVAPIYSSVLVNNIQARCRLARSC